MIRPILLAPLAVVTLSAMLVNGLLADEGKPLATPAPPPPPLESLTAEAPLDAQAEPSEHTQPSVLLAEDPTSNEPRPPRLQGNRVEVATEGLYPAEVLGLKPGRSPKRIVELPADFAAPDRRTVIIPERPDWVEREPITIADTYCVSVSSALQVEQRDCRGSLDEQLLEAVNAYVADHLGSSRANYFIHYDIDEIRNQLVAVEEPNQEFSDIVEVSLGPMHQSHALLRFTPEFRAALDAKWGEICQTGRVIRTAGASVGMLAMLAMVFGYFRLDSATKGYYTRRLQMLLMAAILALVAVGFVYFRNTAELIYRLTM